MNDNTVPQFLTSFLETKRFYKVMNNILFASEHDIFIYLLQIFS